MNRRRLIRPRDDIRDKWMENKNLIWRDMAERIDIERDPKMFRKDKGKMMGRKKEVWVEYVKNETEKELKMKEEIEVAFRKRLETTFYIGKKRIKNFVKKLRERGGRVDRVNKKD